MSRLLCDRCQRPLAACFCRDLKPALAPFQLLILQHPSEQHKAIGTARLVELGISNCERIVGEVFPLEGDLQKRLEQYQGRTWVLYPDADAISPTELKSCALEQGEPLIIILDGTWKKARLIRHVNPWLQELPSVKLEPTVPSEYRIRKVPEAGALSTLEAAVALLQEWPVSEETYQPLLQAFRQMIDFQIKAMGETTWQRNYKDKT